MHWKRKNTILFTIGILFALFLYNHEPFHLFLRGLGNYGYLGAFLAGVLYDSTITVSTSIVILLVLTERLSLPIMAVVATTGAVLGDYLVFRFVKNYVAEDLKPIILKVEEEAGAKRVRVVKHLFHTKYFHWMLPVVAAIMIGSPFPNELAWGLLGTTKIKNYQVILMSFVFNFIGILLILGASNFLKP